MSESITTVAKLGRHINLIDEIRSKIRISSLVEFILELK
jgi:hypothetical protein